MTAATSAKDDAAAAVAQAYSDAPTNTVVDAAATEALNNLQSAVITTLATYTQAGTDADSASGAVTLAAAGLQDLRDAVDDATTTWNSKNDDLNNFIAAVATAQDNYDNAKQARMDAVAACQVAAYDTFRETLLNEMNQREADLLTIKNLLIDAEENKPALGAAGSRCEKAISNGTYRPRMAQGREMVCDEGLCCGASRVWMGSGTSDGVAWMTVETCQDETATLYAYQPPREPMATTMPPPVEVRFTCIEGAKKLAAAASAAVALYMLA